MKILKVRFENLNSLKGVHTVDLSDGPLAESGIFAITGPTGAGKSTILDAITLALYGQAARYEGEPNPHGMMSRHTGECSAEVEFEVASGRYRAAWHLNRARKSPTGKVQPAKRCLYDASDQPIADKLNDVKQMVTKLVGLDVNRFLRSVLLAQNEFAKFLRASADERSMLLEQLTGTSIYSQLGQLTHEMYGDKDKQLGSEKAQIEAIPRLVEEERKNIEEEIKKSKPELEDLKLSLAACREQIGRGEQLQRVLKRKSELEAIQVGIQKERVGFESSSLKIQRHELALGFREEVRQLEAEEQSLKVGKRDLDDSHVEAVAATIRLGAAIDALGVFEKKQNAEFAKSLETLTEERTRTHRELSELSRWLESNGSDASLAAATGDIGAVLSELATDRRFVSTAMAARVTQHEEAKTVAASIKVKKAEYDTAKDAGKQQDKAVSDQQQAFEKLAAGQTIEQLVAATDDARERLQKLTELAACSKQAEERQQECVGFAEEVKRHDATVEKLLAKSKEAESEFKQQEELVVALQTAVQRGKFIASFEDHRHDLKDGEDCPLCGALEHPYADSSDIGQSQLQQEEQRLREAADLQEKRKKKHDDAAAEFGKADKNRQGAVSRLEVLTAQSVELRSQLATDGTKLQISTTDQKFILDSVAAQEKSLADSESLLEDVRKAREKVDDLEKQAIQLQGESKQLQAVLEGKKTTLVRIEKELKVSEERIADREKSTEKQEERLDALLQDFLPAGERIPVAEQELTFRKQLESRAAAHAKNVDKQRKLLKQQEDFDGREAELKRRSEDASKRIEGCRVLGDRVKGWKNAKHAERAMLISEMEMQCGAWSTQEQIDDEIGTLYGRWQEASTTVVERKRAVANLQVKLTSVQSTLEERLAPSTFENPASVRAALLVDAVLESLQAARLELDRQGSENRGQLKSQENDLNELQKQSLVDEERLSELNAELKKQVEEEGKLTTVVTELELRIRDDDRNRADHAARTEGIKTELQSLESWRTLRGLIGSGDGKKFRVFAQGLSLDVLVQLANTHLEKLTDRYRLQRVAGEQLDLEISDQYQAGELRPMKSLSGGESFVASLALALGLSDLAGRNVRIDSLFIDEGFGSLDPETLDVAVAALEGLQATNKTIGVISHVELLKERITTQIRVTPKGGGVSQLEVVA